jgi:hypothetical protein
MFREDQQTVQQQVPEDYQPQGALYEISVSGARPIEPPGFAIQEEDKKIQHGNHKASWLCFYSVLALIHVSLGAYILGASTSAALVSIALISLFAAICIFLGDVSMVDMDVNDARNEDHLNDMGRCQRTSHLVLCILWILVAFQVQRNEGMSNVCIAAFVSGALHGASVLYDWSKWLIKYVQDIKQQNPPQEQEMEA